MKAANNIDGGAADGIRVFKYAGLASGSVTDPLQVFGAARLWAAMTDSGIGWRLYEPVTAANVAVAGEVGVLRASGATAYWVNPPGWVAVHNGAAGAEDVYVQVIFETTKRTGRGGRR